MNMEDPFAEAVNKFNIIHSLVSEVARIIIKTKGRMVIHRLQALSADAISKAISVG